MGEAAPCLVRSLSQPSDLSASKSREVDPLRALTTSISFGRYVSDSSSWEKWSCFTSNRYLEEVERISKPGSVAEKKALLEAHFKKKSSNKENIADSSYNPSNVDNSCTDSLMVSNEMQEKEPDYVVDAVERKELDLDEKETRTIDVVEKEIQIEVPIQPTNKCGDSKEEQKPIADHADKGDLVSKKKRSLNSSKLVTHIRSPKLRSSIKIIPKEDKAAQISKKTERGSSEKKRSKLKSVHMSVDHYSHFLENSKRSNQVIQKPRVPRDVRKSSQMSKDTSTTRQTLTRASVAGTLVQPRATVPLQKRTKIQDTPLIPKSRAKPQSPAIDTSTPGHEMRSPTIATSPFSLRCEERVAKRRQYFQKLEEKQKAMEAGKVNLQTNSEKKSDCDLKKMRQSTNCSWKPNAISRLDAELPNHYAKKIPKLGNKLTSSMVLGHGSRPLLVPPKNNGTTKGNGKKEKSINTPIRSSCTISRKSTNENASPNSNRWL